MVVAVVVLVAVAVELVPVGFVPRDRTCPLHAPVFE